MENLSTRLPLSNPPSVLPLTLPLVVLRMKLPSSAPRLSGRMPHPFPTVCCDSPPSVNILMPSSLEPSFLLGKVTSSS